MKNISRRNFIKKTARDIGKISFSVPILSVLSGCGGGGNSGTKEEDKKDVYVPLVNDIPFKKLDYFIQKYTTNKTFLGISSVFGKDRFYGLAVENQNSQILDGINVVIHEDGINNKMTALIDDPNRNYMPSLSLLHDTSGNYSPTSGSLNHNYSSSVNNVTLHPKETAKNMGNLFVKEISNSLPSWNSENIDAIPGMVYYGDWSFNNLKNLNTNLKRASLVLTLIPEPTTSAVGASSYGILSTTGEVIDYIDTGIDLINFFLSGHSAFWLNKDKKFPIYQFSADEAFNDLVVSLSTRANRGNKIDVKNLIPTTIGSSWTFKSGGNSVKIEVEGERKINGKDLLVIKNNYGIEEYYGFYGNALQYYGFNDPGIGNIFFNPPVKIGDSEIILGKAYSTNNSRIISQNYPQISGSMNDTISYNDRETIVLPNNKPFGDCWKSRENFSMYLHNSENGRSVSSSGEATHWFAKNVGKTKTEFGGRIFYLDRFNIEPHPSWLKANSIEEKISQEEIPSSALMTGLLTEKVAENIKTLK